MKKALSLILALAMALSLAACGGGKTETPSDSNTPADNTSAEPTKLSLILRGGTYADVIKECLPAFEAEHNVVCEVQELSEGDLYSGIALDAINDKGSYDLCMVDGSWMAEFTENGVLANLTELGYSLDEDVIPATSSGPAPPGSWLKAECPRCYRRDWPPPAHYLRWRGEIPAGCGSG